MVSYALGERQDRKELSYSPRWDCELFQWDMGSQAGRHHWQRYLARDPTGRWISAGLRAENEANHLPGKETKQTSRKMSNKSPHPFPLRTIWTPHATTTPCTDSIWSAQITIMNTSLDMIEWVTIRISRLGTLPNMMTSGRTVELCLCFYLRLFLQESTFW